MENFAYRFSGYILPKIQFDLTGDNYIYISLKNIPYENYQQPFYFTNSNYSKRSFCNVKDFSRKLYPINLKKKYK